MSGSPDLRAAETSNVAATIWTFLFVGALVIVPLFIGARMVRNTILGSDDAPSCDSEPVSLRWSEPDFGWQRTGPFTLDAAQTVQVDVRLFDPDGGVIQLGSTVYAVPAGEPFPDFSETATTTTPFGGIRVGHGREAVNEQVRLDAGAWELMLRGVPGRTEVRWPC
jgi:hypothetical protein